uniref:Immunoglobulin domain-containing protein n=1 Tax=Esox lucius TaxID=8010 RepID=A0AAY5KNP2_ESOLU
MEALTILFLCFCAVGATNGSSKIKVELEGDRPFLRVALSLDAYLKCCYKATDVSLDVSWVVTPPNKNRKDSKTMNVTVNNSTANGVMCHSLILQNVNMIDTGFYQCVLNGSYLKEAVWTHGTYLQVYRKVAKTLDISEGAKNSILTAEGVFLMLGVIFPGCMMLCKVRQTSSGTSPPAFSSYLLLVMSCMSQCVPHVLNITYHLQKFRILWLTEV